MIHLDGATEIPPNPPPGLSDQAKRAWSDRWLYHNSDGVYRSTVGMPDGDGGYVCVGCWYCEADAEVWAELRAVEDAADREAGL